MKIDAFFLKTAKTLKISLDWTVTCILYAWTGKKIIATFSVILPSLTAAASELAVVGTQPKLRATFGAAQRVMTLYVF